MTIEYAFFLALIQGLTEFLPISSSAHLILPSAIFGWPDQGLAFDVAVHFGSLGAVMLSLRIEIQRVATGMIVGMGRRYPRHARLGWLIGLATLPAVIAGLLAKDFIETELRSELVIAWATIGFGLLLWWAHYQSGRGGSGARPNSRNLTFRNYADSGSVARVVEASCGEVFVFTFNTYYFGRSTHQNQGFA